MRSATKDSSPPTSASPTVSLSDPPLFRSRIRSEKHRLEKRLNARAVVGAGNIEAIWQNANVAANYSDAIALSLWAGMDQSFDSPGSGFDTSKLRPAIDSGEVKHF